MVAVARSASDVQLNRLHAGAMVATSVYNYGGMGGRPPKNPRQLYPSLFGAEANGYVERMAQAEEAELLLAEQRLGMDEDRRKLKDKEINQKK